ncbi:copper resistance CopC/CopD family protein [soil metagenome]
MTPLAWRRWGWLCCWCALLLALAQPSGALAHASLISSDPVAEAVLAAAPASLTLTFNQAVEPLDMRIVDQRGVATIVTQVERRGASLVLMPPAVLAPGAHILSWRVASEDGHPVGGALTFWIGARGGAVPSVVSSENGVLRIAIWATRIVVYVGLFVGAGGAFFLAWMCMPALAGPRSVVAAACLAGLSALALSVGLQGLDALAAPASDLALPAVWRAGIHGSFGAAAAIAALAMLAGPLSLRLRARAARIVSLLALLGAGVALATIGHATTAEPRGLALAAVALHGISLAFWIGALVPLGFVLGERDAAMQPLTRFSRAIPFAVVALLASGLLLALLQVEHVADLWTTDYGRVLTAKLTLVALLLAVALWNRVSLTPGIAADHEVSRRRMRLSIAGELLLVVVILGVVALWRFMPPPRLLVAKVDDSFTHIHAEKAMANVTITPGSAGPVDIEVQLETPDERPLVAMAVSITLAYPELGIEPMTGQATRQDDGRWRARMSVSVSGRWTLGLGILISDFEKISVEAPILIK